MRTTPCGPTDHTPVVPQTTEGYLSECNLGEGEADHPAPPIAPPREPEPPAAIVLETAETIAEHAPGARLTDATAGTIAEFATEYGEKEARKVVHAYLSEKNRVQVRRFVNADLPERFADAALDLRPRPRWEVVAIGDEPIPGTPEAAKIRADGLEAIRAGKGPAAMLSDKVAETFGDFLRREHPALANRAS